MTDADSAHVLLDRWLSLLDAKTLGAVTPESSIVLDTREYLTRRPEPQAEANGEQGEVLIDAIEDAYGDGIDAVESSVLRVLASRPEPTTEEALRERVAEMPRSVERLNDTEWREGYMDALEDIEHERKD
jgi:hypothetical protein